MQARATFCSCVFSVLLASPLVAFAGSVLFAPAWAAAQAPAHTLSDGVMAKMRKLIAEHGKDREVPALAANSLGLTATGQTWPSHSITWQNDDGTMHSFYLSSGAGSDLIFVKAIPDKIIYAYRTHQDGVVTAATEIDPKTRQVTMRTPAEAQASLNEELALWIHLANSKP